jgi:hypothetical protein
MGHAPAFAQSFGGVPPGPAVGLFHVLLQAFLRAEARRIVLCGPVRGGCFLLGREQDGDGDGRSDFHTRVEYRMNAFRRRPTSDYSRASAVAGS